MSIVYLKVKLKSLAAESKIIRKEENKRSGTLRLGLQEHRRGIVREEARHTHIAYGFLKGMPYTKIEQKPKSEPNWDRVAKMILKYGPYTQWGEPSPQQFAEEFTRWKNNEPLQLSLTLEA